MSLSRVRLFVSSWTIQSMELSRPEYWTGYPFPSPGDLPNPGIKSRSPTLQADSLPAEPPGKPKNTGVGSLSLLQRSSRPRNRIRAFCMEGKILYQLSYQGGPTPDESNNNSLNTIHVIYIHISSIVLSTMCRASFFSDHGLIKFDTPYLTDASLHSFFQ